MHKLYDVSNSSCYLQASEKRYKTRLGLSKAISLPLPECDEAADNGVHSEQVTTIHINCLARYLPYLVTGGGITSTIQCGEAGHHHQAVHYRLMLTSNLRCAASATAAVLHA